MLLVLFPFFVGVEFVGVDRVASDSLGRFRFLSPPFAGEEEEMENGLDEVDVDVTTADPGAREEENRDMISICRSARLDRDRRSMRSRNSGRSKLSCKSLVSTCNLLNLQLRNCRGSGRAKSS